MSGKKDGLGAERTPTFSPEELRVIAGDHLETIAKRLQAAAKKAEKAGVTELRATYWKMTATGLDWLRKFTTSIEAAAEVVRPLVDTELFLSGESRGSHNP